MAAFIFIKVIFIFIEFMMTWQLRTYYLKVQKHYSPSYVIFALSLLLVTFHFCVLYSFFSCCRFYPRIASHLEIKNFLVFKTVVALLCFFNGTSLSTNEMTYARFDILFIIGTVVYICNKKDLVYIVIKCCCW